MYLIRRTYKTKPYEAVNVAKLVNELGSKYRPLLDNSNGPTNWIEFWTILD